MPELEKSGQAPLSNSLPHDAIPSNTLSQTNSLPAPQSNIGSSGQAQSGAPGASPCSTLSLRQKVCQDSLAEHLHVAIIVKSLTCARKVTRLWRSSFSHALCSCAVASTGSLRGAVRALFRGPEGTDGVPDEEAGKAANAEQGISAELALNRNNFSDVSLSDSPRCFCILLQHTKRLIWLFLVVV